MSYQGYLDTHTTQGSNVKPIGSLRSLGSLGLLGLYL